MYYTLTLVHISLNVKAEHEHTLTFINEHMVTLFTSKMKYFAGRQPQKIKVTLLPTANRASSTIYVSTLQ